MLIVIQLGWFHRFFRTWIPLYSICMFVFFTAGCSYKSLHSGQAYAEVEPIQKTRIVIIAGHGGDDSGGIGPSGITEKDITLQFSQRLFDTLLEEGQFTPFQVRSGDYFISLRNRLSAANEYGADIIIDLHATPRFDSSERGVEVYTLSTEGARRSFSRALSHITPALPCGIEQADLNSELYDDLLLDCGVITNMQASRRIATYLLMNLDEVTTLATAEVQHANFATLRCLTIPTVMIELGNIQNFEDEQMLISPDFQKRIVGAIVDALKEYTTTAL